MPNAKFTMKRLGVEIYTNHSGDNQVSTEVYGRLIRTISYSKRNKLVTGKLDIFPRTYDRQLELALLDYTFRMFTGARDQLNSLQMNNTNLTQADQDYLNYWTCMARTMADTNRQAADWSATNIGECPLGQVAQKMVEIQKTEGDFNKGKTLVECQKHKTDSDERLGLTPNSNLQPRYVEIVLSGPQNKYKKTFISPDKVTLMTIDGKVVYQANLAHLDKPEIEIDLNGFKLKGIYSLEIRSKEQMFLGKIWFE